MAHSIGQTSFLTSIIGGVLYNGDHLVPLGLWLPVLEAVASGPDLCRWQGLLGSRLRDALTVCLGLQGKGDPLHPSLHLFLQGPGSGPVVRPTYPARW